MLKAKGQWNMGSFRVSASAEEFSVEQKILYSIKGIGGDISDWNMDICEGEMFSGKDVQNEKRVCLLSENFMKLNDYDIGDYFLVKELSFKIIGVTHSLNNEYSISVPYNFLNTIYPEESLQHVIYILDTEQMLNKQTVQRGVEGLDVVNDIYEIGSYQDMIDSTRYFVTRMIGVRLLAGAVISVFGILNIFMVILGILQTRRKEFAVRRAAGATSSSLFTLFFLENMLSMVVAIVLILCSFEPVSVLFGLNKEVVFDTSAKAGLSLLGTVFCGIICWLLQIRINKEKIYSMLQEEEF
ncbi:ABC transporter permease [Ohessyouella blattaphilus]|uniref:ABC transporter permease n=1 Tax=Ohessyouella blattaphilus TaxID=2949333 RepID=UPI0025663C50|nr:ABC transporter permease [Lachnospiraceae bacterium OttesenSCG-928-J05]